MNTHNQPPFDVTAALRKAHERILELDTSHKELTDAANAHLRSVYDTDPWHITRRRLAKAASHALTMREE